MLATIWTRLLETGRLWSAKGGTFMAASQAFHVALAFFPVLLLGISLLGLLLRSGSFAGAEQRLVDLLAAQTSPALADQVRLLLAQVQRGAALGGQLGLLALLGSLVSIFYHMQKAFDLVWEVDPVPPGDLVERTGRYLRVELQHFLVWAGLGVLLVLLFAASLAASVLQAAYDLLGGAAALRAAPAVASLAAATALFALVYKTQPRVRVAWRDVWPGAAVAALAWEVGRQLLAFGVGTSRYGTYGVVGSFLVVMIWLYFANSVLYLGAMLVRATSLDRARRSGRAERRGSTSPRSG